MSAVRHAATAQRARSETATNILGAWVLTFLLAGLACGGPDDGSDGDSTGETDDDTGTDTSPSTGTEDETGGTCGLLNCTGGIRIHVDGGPTLSSKDYASVSCVLTEDDQGLLIGVQRHDSCDGTGAALVATFRVPFTVTEPGVHVLSQTDVGASWSLQNGPDEYTGAYIGGDDATLELESISWEPGGNLVGSLSAPVSAPVLMLTGSAIATFDVTLE